MKPQLLYASVLDEPRKIIHVVRVVGEIIELHEISEIITKTQDRMLSKYGEQFANVVLVQGNSKETLHLFGDFHAVSRVRTAMFHAAISWQPIEL